jgi:hypothetical protein
VVQIDSAGAAHVAPGTYCGRGGYFTGLHGVIDQGAVNSGVLSDGRKYTFNGFNRPSSILFTEAFLIEGGKIRRVEMVGPSAPFHMNSPWPGGLSGD